MFGRAARKLSFSLALAIGTVGYGTASARDSLGTPRLGVAARAACNQVQDVEQFFVSIASKLAIWERTKNTQVLQIEISTIWSDIAGTSRTVSAAMSRPDAAQADRNLASEITERVLTIAQHCRTSLNDFFGSLQVSKAINFFSNECKTRMRDVHTAYCGKKTLQIPECVGEAEACGNKAWASHRGRADQNWRPLKQKLATLEKTTPLMTSCEDEKGWVTTYAREYPHIHSYTENIVGLLPALRASLHACKISVPLNSCDRAYNARLEKDGRSIENKARLEIAIAGASLRLFQKDVDERVQKCRTIRALRKELEDLRRRKNELDKLLRSK
jgi:hypothetical protein